MIAKENNLEFNLFPVSVIKFLNNNKDLQY
jgi:hypothetical protein